MKYNFCIGNFDGVHKGHQALIARTIALSNQRGEIPGAITFDPDPAVLFSKGSQKVITTAEQKRDLLLQYGLEEVIIMPFDEVLAKMSPNSFIRFILNQLDIHTLVVGPDFRFGDRGEGSVATLQESEIRNFDVDVVDFVKVNDEKISSTMISQLISAGKIAEANALMGHEYHYAQAENIPPKSGKYEVVIKGEQKSYKFNSEAKPREITFIKELD